MKTPITYYGGKQSLLQHILPMIPPHQRYTEAFCGGAAVLFAKTASPSEVINDLNGELTNFYYMSQMYYDELKTEIENSLHSRDSHAHARHVNAYPQFFSAAKRAWAVWYLSHTSFASRQDGAFGYDFSGGMPKRLSSSKDEFTEAISKRLEKVTIENRNALDVIACYDSVDTFHFVDPPYINSNCGHYEGLFNKQHLDLLLALLASLKGSFMLTMFPDNSIESAAKEHGWIINKVSRTISASRESRRKQEEWIVCNYSFQRHLNLFE